MKALGYLKAHPLEAFSIREFDPPMPVPGADDLLVQVRAVSVNPVDTKVRQGRSAETGEPVILGWDASGVVAGCGASVERFKKGDEVFYAGELTRPGCNAEYQAVDHRLVSLKPKNLSFVESAALPLTSLTAYEMLFEQFGLLDGEKFDLLVIGGAGGVGSMAVQLVRALTKGRVFSTGGRESSREWLSALGVDGVLDRKKPLRDEMKKLGLSRFDHVFSTTHTQDYLSQIADILRPFGNFGLIDDPGAVDVAPMKRKSVRVSWEFMFSKSMFDYRPESQGAILSRIARLAEEKRIRSTANEVLKGLNTDNLLKAHRRLEEGTAIGKIVLSL